ncbi:MAG: hypothetical protein PHI64_12620 [Zoogloea sp.]|uniref:hypothetical protein n=1 Tax=Zoogloea sp. TaxID=49181 RepID=UPI00261CB9E3|nr:hypothetical protein [Zoogloea sp.]MDD2989792.1 hypothetical protein [Zoogloea sp.]
MQLRFVYSTFTHTRSYDPGSNLVGEGDSLDLRFPDYTTLRPLHTPATVLVSVGGSDAQLAAILGVIGDEGTSEMYPYDPFPVPWLLGTGVMPDGNQFIELDVSALIDRTFDEWQWYVDNDPGAPTLPAGFNPAWMTRRADVHTFKSDPTNIEIRIKTGKHDLYSGDLNARISPHPDYGLIYSYGLPSVTEAWVYDMASGSLVGDDTGMSVSSFANPEEGVGPTEFDLYAFILSGGAPNRFWTNFKACVEDV